MTDPAAFCNHHPNHP